MANPSRFSGPSPEKSEGQTTKERATSMMEQGKEAVSSTLEKGREAAQDMTRRAGDMAGNVGERAGEAVSSVGGQMRSLAGTIRENVPQQGLMGTAASTVADTLDAGGHYLQEQHIGDIGRDLVEIVRRYPITAVCAGVCLGFFLARTSRS